MMLARKSPIDFLSCASAQQLCLGASHVQCNNNQRPGCFEVSYGLERHVTGSSVFALGDAPA